MPILSERLGGIEGYSFGLGIGAYIDPNYGLTYSKLGSIPGYTAASYFIPSKNAAIAIQVASWPADDYWILPVHRELMQNILTNLD